MTATSPEPFAFPAHHAFPPFYTLQPNVLTRASQLSSWSQLATAYAAHHRLYRLTPSHALFANARLARRLAPDDARTVLQYMVERGAASWVSPATKGNGGEVWVWWRTPEEWAAALAGWAERTGQRNTVLTLWELVEGEDETAPFAGLPVEMAVVAVGVLVGRGKASLFGEGDGRGVKFYF